MKKSISFLTIISIILTVLGLSTIVPNAETSGDYTYSFLSDGTISITRYNGLEKSVEIPAEIDGYMVTGIKQNAFLNVENIIIGNNITSIGDRAFYYCKKLKQVTICDSVLSIGNEAFRECSSLEKITFGNSVRIIGNESFYGCLILNSVNLPDSLVYLGSSAFKECNKITEINIPSSVISIGDYAFQYCYRLVKIQIPPSVINIGRNAFESTPWYANQANGLVNAGNVVYTYKGECPSEVVIPNGIIGIAAYAFCDCTQLEKIIAPDSLINVGINAFYRTKWFQNQNDGVVYVGKVAYTYKGNCPSNLQFENGTVGISDNSFRSKDSITYVTIPDTVSYIGSRAFHNCPNLHSVTIPKSVNIIGRYAFGHVVKIELQNNYYPIGDFSITGYTNSAAKVYALDYGFKFIPKDKLLILGDIDGKDGITIIDVTFLQRKLVNISLDFEFNNIVADVNEDGSIDIVDATCIQQFIAQFSSTNKIGTIIT